MVGHMLRYGDELLSLITKGMVKRTRSRRPKTKYISQIIKNVIFFKELKNMTNNREKREFVFCYKSTFKLIL